MTEPRRTKRDLVPASRPDAAASRDTGRFGLDDARAMLRIIASIPSDAITRIASLGGYTLRDIPLAFHLVTSDLFQRHEKDFHGRLVKADADGILGLSIDTRKGERLELQYITNAGSDFPRRISARIPLLEEDFRDAQDQGLIQFKDTGGKGRRREVVQVKDVFEITSPEELELQWKGMQWVAANLDQWESEAIVLPEHLNTNPPGTIATYG